MKKLFVAAALTITSVMDITFKSGRTVVPAIQPMLMPVNREQRRAFEKMNR